MMHSTQVDGKCHTFRMYEYKIYVFGGAENPERGLNDMAEEGWRLVQAVNHGPKTYFVFEREKSSLKSSQGKGSQ
jgi:hypothetical protein